MSKRLTAAAVERLRPGTARMEIPDAGSEGLRLVIQPSGAKSWAMRFRRPDGRHAKLTLGRVDLSGREGGDTPAMGAPLTLKEARWLAADVHRRRAGGEDVTARRIEAGSDAFAAVAEDFIRDHRRDNKTWRDVARVLGLTYVEGADSPTVVPGSLAERWKRKPIGSITTADIHAVIAESIKHGIPGIASRTGDDPSSSRGRKMGDALGALFRWAGRHRRHALTANPMAGVWRPGPPPSRHRVLNFRADRGRADELRWFWAAAGEVGEPFGAMLKLLLITGARLREVAWLQVVELNDDCSVIDLPGARTKNKLPHAYPLPPTAQELLEAVPRVEGCRFVFTTTGRTPVSGFSNLKRQLDAAMLRIAREEKGDDFEISAWRLHDLRRTASTGMAHLGVAPHIVEAALNHISGAKAGVAGVYNREQYLAERKAALEGWAAHLAAMVSEGDPRNVVALRRA